MDKLIPLHKSVVETIADNYYHVKAPERKIMIINVLKDVVLQAVKDKIKELEDDYIENHKGQEVIIGENYYFIGHKKTNRYNTQEIYNECQKCPDPFKKLLPMLPANPTSKKTEVIKLMEETGKELWHEDVEEKLQVKSIPKKLKKELDNAKSITNNR